MSFPTEEKGPAPNDRKHLRSGNLYPPGSLLYNGRAARYTSARGVTGNNNQIRFGVFEVRRETRELRKHGVRIKLEEQPFELLMALLEKPGDIVTRSELRAGSGQREPSSISTRALPKQSTRSGRPSAIRPRTRASLKRCLAGAIGSSRRWTPSRASRPTPDPTRRHLCRRWLRRNAGLG